MADIVFRQLEDDKSKVDVRKLSGTRGGFSPEDLEKPKRTFVVFFEVKPKSGLKVVKVVKPIVNWDFFWGGGEQMIIVDNIGEFLKWGHRRYPEIIQDI